MDGKLVSTTSRFCNFTFYYTNRNERTEELYAVSRFNRCAQSNSEHIKDSTVEVDNLLTLQVFEYRESGWKEIQLR